MVETAIENGHSFDTKKLTIASTQTVKATRLFVHFTLSLDYCTKTRYALPAGDAKRYTAQVPRNL